MKEYIPKRKGAKLIGEQLNNGVTSPEEIAKNTGYSLSTVRYYLSLYYPSQRIRTCEYKGRPVSETTREIVYELKAGKRKANIARQFGVSRQRVQTVYNKYVKGEKDMEEMTNEATLDTLKEIAIQFSTVDKHAHRSIVSAINLINTLKGEYSDLKERYVRVLGLNEKVIDEQKAEIERLKTFIDFKTANIMCAKCKQRVVKDTAKEIFEEIFYDCWAIKGENGQRVFVEGKIKDFAKKCYGVEVE